MNVPMSIFSSSSLSIILGVVQQLSTVRCSIDEWHICTRPILNSLPLCTISWWPEAPVILSILYTTVVMVDVSLNVYKKEKASSRYTGGSNKLSKMVFKQALWFVGAFYITWGPYLALQVRILLVESHSTDSPFSYLYYQNIIIVFVVIGYWL